MVNYVHNCPIWAEPHEVSGLWRPETRTYEVSQSPRAGNGGGIIWSIKGLQSLSSLYLHFEAKENP